MDKKDETIREQEKQIARLQAAYVLSGEKIREQEEEIKQLKTQCVEMEKKLLTLKEYIEGYILENQNAMFCMQKKGGRGRAARGRAEGQAEGQG